MIEDQDKAPVPKAEIRLETWKEIAEYLRRDVRTAQRWEREQGLPVRRHAHQKRSSVYAFPRELDEWRDTRAPRLDPTASPSSPEEEAAAAAEPVVLPPRQGSSAQRRTMLLAAGAMAVLAVGIVAGWLVWSRFRPPTFRKIDIHPLIAAGNALTAAVSPDGRYLIYATAGTGGQTAWLRDLVSGSSIQIGAPSSAGYQQMRFSGNGEFVRFFQSGGLYETPIRGGQVRKLAQGMPGYLALSPDGRRIALKRRVKNETQLLVANADGSGERTLVVRQSPASIPHFTWAPDGKSIACAIGSSLFAGTDAALVVVDAGSGREQPVGSRKWWSIDQVEWLANGRGLLLVARELPLRISRPWYVSYPDGEAHAITNDLADYSSVSPANDSRSFVSVQQADVSSLWVVNGGGDGTAKRISGGMRRKDGVGGIAWTADRRIIYVSSFSGTMQIWSLGADGGEAKAVGPEGEAAQMNPSVCGNGRFVVFNSGPGPAGRHVWRMELDGSRPVQLTAGADESWPVCSADGKWVLYLSLAPRYALMRVSIDGGAPSRITQESIVMPSISPDGKTILGTYSIGSANRVVTMPAVGGPVSMHFDIEGPKAHWSPDGKSVLYLETRDGIGNIWSRSLATGGDKRQLTRFSDNEDIRWFAVSPTGELAVARGTTIRDIIRIVDLP